MALQSGHLGGTNLTANNEATVYQCLAPTTSTTFTAAFCNKTSSTVRVRLAHGTGANSSSPGTLFYEFDAEIPANDVLERAGLVTSVGRKIFAVSDKDGVDISIFGFEKG